MVVGGLAVGYTPRLRSQVSKYDINSMALPQIAHLHALIAALHQVT